MESATAHLHHDSLHAGAVTKCSLGIWKVASNSSTLDCMWRTSSAVTMPLGTQRPSDFAVIAAPCLRVTSGLPSLKLWDTDTAKGCPWNMAKNVVAETVGLSLGGAAYSTGRCSSKWTGPLLAAVSRNAIYYSLRDRSCGNRCAGATVGKYVFMVCSRLLAIRAGRWLPGSPGSDSHPTSGWPGRLAGAPLVAKVVAK